jgi:protein-tyrosine-phosphatase
MAEIGIDISDHWSKSLKEFEVVTFDYVATVVVEKVKYVHFSLEEKIISTNHLKTLQQLMEQTKKKLMLSQKLGMKLGLG